MRISVSFLPILLCLSGTFSCSLQAQKPEPTDERPGNVRRVPVIMEQAQRRLFEERLDVHGNVEAKDIVSVPARINGTLLELFVDEGDMVVAGKTPLLQTDDLNLRNTLELRRLDLSVAECGVREKDAGLEREKADLDRKEKDFMRQKRLFEDDRIGTLDKVEEAESEYRQALASVKYAETLLALSREQARQAATAVRIAEKNLSDATVLAPISGMVSERLQEPGEMGGPAKTVFRIVDLSKLEVSAYLPSRHYPQIIPGETRMHVEIDSRDLGERIISYRAPVIDPVLRVFEVKCPLGPETRDVAPGAMANVSVVLRQETTIGVPDKAVVRRNDQDVVFRVEGDMARIVPVTKGLITDGWAEVITGNVAADMSVVTMGQFLLDDGIAVDIRTPTAPSVDFAARKIQETPQTQTPAVREN